MDSIEFYVTTPQGDHFSTIVSTEYLAYLRDKNNRIEAENVRLRMAIEKVEFITFENVPLFGEINICPWCYGVKQHKRDCQRQAALGIEVVE